MQNVLHKLPPFNLNGGNSHIKLQDFQKDNSYRCQKSIIEAFSLIILNLYYEGSTEKPKEGGGGIAAKDSWRRNEKTRA